MRFYEVVRIANAWPETQNFDSLKKLIDRGWFRKAVAFLSDWDYGGENIDAARANGTVRDIITDPAEPSDKVIFQDDHYWLCQSYCPSGLYEAFYLVAAVSEDDLS